MRCMTKPDVTKLSCKDNIADYKGWTVSSYRREIQGMKGRIFKGDFRTVPLPSSKEAQEFEYTLLVSESNEHAIEVEKYSDGRVEAYATVYRRMNDVGEITHPAKRTGPPPRHETAEAGHQAGAKAGGSQPVPPAKCPNRQTGAAEPPEPAKPVAAEAANTAPIELQEFTAGAACSSA